MQLKEIFSALISLVLCISYFRCPDCSAKGNQLIIDQGHLGQVTALSFSADGKLFATGSWDKSLIVWDTLTGGQRLVLHSSSRITAVAFSVDSKTLAAGTADSTVELFDIATTQAVRTLGRPVTDPLDTSGFDRHPIIMHDVNGLAFSADGRTLACTIGDHELQMWNYLDGSRLKSPEEAASSCKNFLAGTTITTTIQAWN